MDEIARKKLIEDICEAARQSAQDVVDGESNRVIKERDLALKFIYEAVEQALTHIPENETLRDRFAMAALTGIVSCVDAHQMRIAEMAYEAADAMLKAREEK